MEWHEIFTSMTKDQAFYVRELRCGQRQHSWRRIAELCSEKWGGTWGDNQMAGQDLCRAAAAMLGEDWNSEEWN